MKEVLVDICIIGGGASGLASAIKAADAESSATIAVLEKLPDVGHKVAAAGNGRCNLSNIESPEWPKTSAFFSSLGLFTRIDQEGRVYPYSEDGRDVVSILKRACLDRGVELLTRREVTSVSLNDSDTSSEGYKFSILTTFNKPKAYWAKEEAIKDGLLRGIQEDDDITFFAKKVLISTGGKSKPKLGTTGDGYRFAKALGHSVTPLIPVLTGVETEEDFTDIAGIRQKAKVSLRHQSDIIFSENGEIQFTDYGVSGICIFNLTRFIEGRDFSKYEIEIDFIPDFKEEMLKTLMEEKADICSLVKAPLAKRIKSNPDALIENLKAYKIHPKSFRGWDMAQVTRGGVPLSEINKKTGESLIVPGLYLAGEVLDQDFMCGGFNLQNAWTTGIRAGIAMGENR